MKRLRASRMRNPSFAGRKGYQHSWKFEDADTHLWTLDLFGSVLAKPAMARSTDGAPAWSTQRNRLLFPSAWYLEDAGGRRTGALSAHWLNRTGWQAHTADGAEVFSLQDPRKGIEYALDLPGCPGEPDWIVTRGQNAIGWLDRVESREKPEDSGPSDALAKRSLRRDWLMEIDDSAETVDPRLMALAILMAQEVTQKLNGTA